MNVFPDSNKVLIPWTVTPSLVEAFHAAFYSFPHLAASGGAFTICQVLSSCPPLHGPTSWSFRYDPLPSSTFRAWGTQAIDCSWASLDTFHAAQTSSAMIQDVESRPRNRGRPRLRRTSHGMGRDISPPCDCISTVFHAIANF